MFGEEEQCLASKLQHTQAVTYLPVLKEIVQSFPSCSLKEKTLNSFGFKTNKQQNPINFPKFQPRTM